MSYVCSSCGETHDGLPDLGFDRPIHAEEVPPEERAARVRLDSDRCVLDDELFFIRGVIEIPVHGQSETFGLGVWVTQKRENFETYLEEPDSAAIGPFFGSLANELRFGGAPTLNLKTRAHFRGGDLRPRIEFEPTDHPLARAEPHGISLDDAWRFVHEHLAR